MNAHRSPDAAMRPAAYVIGAVAASSPTGAADAACTSSSAGVANTIYPADAASAVVTVPAFEHSVSAGKIIVDRAQVEWFNSQAVFEARPYLSWIEDLTTNQGVVGSNPTGRASFTDRVAKTATFLFMPHVGGELS